MDLITIVDGKWLVPIWYSPAETFEPDMGFGERFRLIFVEKGSGILRVGEKRRVVIAPTLLCINETEKLELESAEGLSARGLYLVPGFINWALNFDNVREMEQGSLSFTDAQDRAWLSCFVERDAGYTGQLSIGPASAQRVAYLLDSINRELTEQPDYCVCRSRSFLLEILFLIGRLRRDPESMGDVLLPESPSEVDDVLLFLHTEYHSKVTITDLSKRFHLGKTTLNDRFTEAVGQPPMSYLIGLRIKLAQMMLRDTRLPIGEIMDRVGFGNSSHFVRTFRKYTGLSPSEYREEFCWMKMTS